MGFLKTAWLGNSVDGPGRHTLHHHHVGREPSRDPSHQVTVLTTEGVFVKKSSSEVHGSFPSHFHDFQFRVYLQHIDVPSFGENVFCDFNDFQFASRVHAHDIRWL